jgi:hypothetical protein
VVRPSWLGSALVRWSVEEAGERSREKGEHGSALALPNVGGEELGSSGGRWEVEGVERRHVE